MNELHRPAAATSPLSGADGDLLCLYYPQQVLPALAAVVTYRERHGIDPTRTVHAVLWSTAGPASRSAVVETLLGAFPWVRLWAPTRSGTGRDLPPRRRVAARARFFRERFQDVEVGTVFYPHDLTSDFLPESMSQAFPRAHRVCFGDGLGMVCTRAYFERHLYGAATLQDLLKTPATALRHRLARLRRSWTRRDDGRAADSYVLILPHDPTGDLLSAGNLTVVPYACACDILTSLAATVQSRARAAAPALLGGCARVPIVLLGSFSESRMCSEADELALYREVLRAHVPPGRRVALKPHAASSDGKVARLIESIGPDYEARVFDRELAEVPIELLDAMVRERPVLSFSHSSVALAYFDLGEARHVLTEERIERYFPPFIRAWMIESNRQYLSQQHAARQARQPAGAGR